MMQTKITRPIETFVWGVSNFYPGSTLNGTHDRRVMDGEISDNQ